MFYSARSRIDKRFPKAYESLRSLKKRKLHRDDQIRLERFSKREISNTNDLLSAHFEIWSKDKQKTRRGFSLALESLGGKQALIIETGTSAWGVDSTRLFDAYVKLFGGKFLSVDLRHEPSDRLENQICERTQLYVSDSVEFLHNLKKSLQDFSFADLIYLDSYDVDLNNPEPSAMHGLREWEALAPLLRSGSMILIDDTPLRADMFHQKIYVKLAKAWEAEHGYVPGKGALILEKLKEDPNYEVVYHGYNVLIKVK